MPYDDPSLKQFENYYLSHKPSERERAENWAIAIGLQKVDGLTPSEHLIAVAKKHIEGKISSEKAVQLVDRYYETKSGHDEPEDKKEADRVSARINQVIEEDGFYFSPTYLTGLHGLIFAENSWYFRNALVRANYDNPLQGIDRDFGPLERFFGNLMLGEHNELKSRYLLIGLTEEDKRKIRELSEGKAGQKTKSGQKKAVRKKRSEKSGQKTVDRLLSLLKAQPHLTQEGMVNALMVTRSTIQKHLANLKKAGRLRRVGPDKGGHWEVIG